MPQTTEPRTGREMAEALEQAGARMARDNGPLYPAWAVAVLQRRCPLGTTAIGVHWQACADGSGHYVVSGRKRGKGHTLETTWPSVLAFLGLEGGK